MVSGCIDSDGDLYTWGAAINEMFGYRCDEDVLVPRKVPRTRATQGKRFKTVRFGGQHCAVLGE